MQCQYRTQGAFLHCRHQAQFGVRYQLPGRWVVTQAVCGNHHIALSYRSRRDRWPLFEELDMRDVPGVRDEDMPLASGVSGKA